MRNVGIINGDDDHYIYDNKLHLEGAVTPRTPTTSSLILGSPQTGSSQGRGINVTSKTNAAEITDISCTSTS